MKQTLTENISRYDNKMRLRLDKKTALAFLLSIIPAALIGWALSFVLSVMLWLPFSVVIFLALFLLQIGLRNGMPLYAFLIEILRQTKRTKVKYLYTSEDRITGRSSMTKEEGKGDGKRQKQKE